MKRIIFLSGPAGSGISSIAQTLPTERFRVIENLPVEALDAVVDIAAKSAEEYVFTFPLDQALAWAQKKKIRGDVDALFLLLNSDLDQRIGRHRLNRHLHPLQEKGIGLEDALSSDDAIMEEVIPFADFILDTSDLVKDELRLAVLNILNVREQMLVRISSCGLRFGAPKDPDVVLDCRNAPNPFWDPKLRDFNGYDQPIIDFMNSHEGTEEIYDSMRDYLSVFLKGCKETNRRYVSVYVVCTGGQHRSVYYANRLYEEFSKEYACELHHREQKRWGVK